MRFWLKSVLRIFMAAMILLAGVLAVSYLQHRFDRSDIKHAVEAVKKARPDAGQPKDIEEILSENFGVKKEEILWKPHIESKWKGTVRVDAVVPNSTKSYAWDVDLVRFQIKPLTPDAATLIPKN